MPDDATNHYGSKFASRVIHFYQQNRRLRETVETQNLTDAKDYTFFRMGKSDAAERARGGTLTAQNIDMPTVKCTPIEVSGLHWVDRQDEKRMTYNQSDQLSRSLAMALGRKADGQIISAAEAGEALAVADGRAAVDFSGGNPELEHLVEIVAEMEERDVDDQGDINVLVSPRVFSHFLLFDAFSNSDWIEMGDRALAKKTRIRGKRWNGTNILKHTGLTKTAGTPDKVDCIAYHSPAIGHCTLDEVDIETASTLSLGKPGTNIYGFLDMQAVPIDFDGIQVFTMKDVPASG